MGKFVIPIHLNCAYFCYLIIQMKPLHISLSLVPSAEVECLCYKYNKGCLIRRLVPTSSTMTAFSLQHMDTTVNTEMDQAVILEHEDVGDAVTTVAVDQSLSDIYTAAAILAQQEVTNFS